MFDNCTACTTSGTYASFLSTVPNPDYTTCVNQCPPDANFGYFGNRTTRTCDPCNATCETCINSANYCTSCKLGFYWAGWSCYNPCPANYFLDANGTNCTKCLPFCSECITTNSTCTACTLTGQYKAFLYNLSDLTGSCERLCPAVDGFYGETFNGTGPNLCLKCHDNCTMCTGNPSPCSQCAIGLFLYEYACTDTCPDGYVASVTTGTGVCLNCAIMCVDLTINMYFPSVVSDMVYIDMVFSQELDFTNFNWETFQTINVTSKDIQYTMDMFTATYTLLGPSSYRIKLEPKTYIFLYNATFTVTTEAEPAVLDTSVNSLPFKVENYLKKASLTWFLIKGPPFNKL